MAINFSEDAKNLIKNKKYENESILLDLDDGVGMFSKVGQCSLDTSFRIILADNEIDFKKDYNLEIESNLGIVYVKKSSDYYFKDDISFSVKENSQTLQMRDTSELLDGSVGIEHIGKGDL